MNLTGKRALVTGGTKGIGAAIAIDLPEVRANSIRQDRQGRDAPPDHSVPRHPASGWPLAGNLEAGND